MGGDEDKHLMFFPGLMQMRQGSTAGHAFSLPGFPPQVHLPMPPPLPGAHTYARPGYAYAQAGPYAYPPPPAGPYAYPPQGYPHPGSSAPHQGLLGHGSSGHGGGRRMESIPKAGGAAAATASATTTAYGGISHESSDHGGGWQTVMIESKPKAGGASASASAYGARNKLPRGQGSRNGAFGFLGSFCSGHRGTFKHAAGQGKLKRPAKVEHVHGNFSAKCTTWK